MPGKVNPVICEVAIQVGAQVIGNDAAITIAGSQGQFELNVRVPLIARNLLDSIKLLGRRLPPARHQVRAGHRGRRGGGRAPRRGDPGHGDGAQSRTSATTGGPRSSRRRHESGRPLREVAREMGVDEEILEQALDHRKMARPHELAGNGSKGGRGGAGKEKQMGQAGSALRGDRQGRREASGLLLGAVRLGDRCGQRDELRDRAARRATRPTTASASAAASARHRRAATAG